MRKKKDLSKRIREIILQRNYMTLESLLEKLQSEGRISEWDMSSHDIKLKYEGGIIEDNFFKKYGTE